jgi:Flp pilus assembly protein TadG
VSRAALFVRRLLRDRTASMAIEFAVLAPAFFAMFIGLFQVSVYLQNYNAVRSLASDAVRAVTVAYQKDNKLTPGQIESIMLGMAVNTPYMLDTDRIDINVEDVTADGTKDQVAGATRYDVNIVYVEEDWLPFVDLPDLSLNYSRPIFVVS